MKKFQEIKSIIRDHKRELEGRFNLKQIGVFGSFVRNEQKKKSDLDILVEYKEVPGLFKFMELEEYLSRILGVKVDLVMKSALKPVIGRYILKEVIYL